jgi:hypothetical protein
MVTPPKNVREIELIGQGCADNDERTLKELVAEHAMPSVMS